jgi:hypothetical protein
VTVAHLLAKDFRGISNTTNDAKATSIGDGSSELRTSSHIHSKIYIRMRNSSVGTRAMTYPASRMGCWMPKSSVIGVVMTAIATRKKKEGGGGDGGSGRKGGATWGNNKFLEDRGKYLNMLHSSMI